MVLKNLLRRKTRTLLTMLGIAIGVSAVVALSAFAEGYINSYTTILTSSGADIIVTQGDALDIILAAVDDTVGPQLAALPGVRQVSGVALGLISTPEVPYFAIFGLDPREFGMNHYKVTDGQRIAGPRQLLLGKTAATSFKKQVGDNFKIQEVSFRVVGIYETGQNIEDMGAVIVLKEAQEVFKKPRQVAYYQIQSKSPDMTLAIIKEIERRFPKLTASRSSTYMDTMEETQMLRAMGWFIGLLAMLAGGLVMMNTMLMSVFERTREIGVLRALGWRRSRVLRLVLGEALVLSLLGGTLGILLGVAMVYWMNQVPALMGFLDNALSPAIIAQGMVTALILGAAGGLYPAWRAARLQPIEAMRYEGASSGGRSQRTSGFSVEALFSDMAVRNVLRQRTRTLLTALAIGVGVGLAVAMGGMAEGLLGELSSIGARSGELAITQAKASDMSMAAIDDKVGRWVAGLPLVEHVSGAMIGVASVPGTPYFLAWGFEPTGYAIQHFAVTEGDRLRLPRDMLLGKVAAKNLKKRVGDQMTLSGNTFRIVGLYETGIGYEDGAGVIALQEAQRIFKKPNQVSFYYVKLKDPAQAATVQAQVEARWREVSVSKSSEFAEKTNDMQTFNSMSNALSLVSVLIGGVGIMNAMLMSVFERTREIGTLRALGWKRGRVVGMIIRESLILSLLSGLAGIAMGIGLGTLLTLEPTMGSFLKGSYSPQLLGQALFVALTLGAVGALYPAWRAANLSPIEALRYE